jgi:hypothetical protein
MRLSAVLDSRTANNSHALVVQGSFALSADTTIEKKPHNVVALKDGSSCMVNATTILDLVSYKQYQSSCAWIVY